jgi:hypothetical protein
LNPDQPERSGILAGGDWIVDRTKMTDVYPGQDRLANIIGETSSAGLQKQSWSIHPMSNLLSYRSKTPL